jgi:hypothetical protein
MNDMTQQIKDNVFQNANDKKIFIEHAGKKHPAQLYGRLLDYPVISEQSINGLQAQISWSAAQRLAEGTINTISI